MGFIVSRYGNKKSRREGIKPSTIRTDYAFDYCLTYKDARKILAFNNMWGNIQEGTKNKALQMHVETLSQCSTSQFCARFL